MKKYYNTNNLCGNALKVASMSNERQELRILRYINLHPGTHTAWSISETSDFYNIPITSIRRALFNLKDQCLIRDIGMAIGKYGKPVTVFQNNVTKQLSIF